ncbi:MAG: FTR1 family protein [Gemmatimonadales bacterium]
MAVGLGAALPAQQIDSLSAARRIAAAATLAAKEYAQGVVPGGGRVTLPEEVDEAKLFIDQARLDVPALPAGVRLYADSAMGTIRGLLDRLAPPDVVARRASELVRRLGAALGGPLDPLPARPPSLARGAQVYREQCAACHGDAGRGDGPKARSLEGPPPANLADPALLVATPPSELYSKITIGVPGTAMPEFEGTLSPEDRWAVTAYVATLWTAERARSTEPPSAAIFASVRRQVDSAVATGSDRLAFDAYLTFEQVETELRARNPGLAAEAEAGFAALRTRVTGASGAQRDSLKQALLAVLERAERAVADRPSGAHLFVQSFMLVVREGFEAILILAALLTFLTRAGATERRKDVVRGAWYALIASGLTWLLVEVLFRITPGQREALEGFTMLLATAVLFYVSYWLLSKIEAAKWSAFVKGKMQDALQTGSGLSLAAVAFLAVYREGFETILFYQALLTSAGAPGAAAGAGTASVVGGLILGGAALAALYVGINRFGLRVPMKPFFAVTSAMLYYMAFVFAGKGMAELQEAGLVRTTVIEWAPRIPVFGVYPTVQSLAVQGLLVLLALVALAWTMRKPPAISQQPSTV